jgi:hypothetical protein
MNPPQVVNDVVYGIRVDGVFVSKRPISQVLTHESGKFLPLPLGFFDGRD